MQSDSVADCNINIRVTATLINTAGFVLHPDKSVLIPAQKMTFFGAECPEHDYFTLTRKEFQNYQLLG